MNHGGLVSEFDDIFFPLMQCHIVYCDQSCEHGSCTGPNQCTCELGWTGKDCSIGKRCFWTGS